MNQDLGHSADDQTPHLADPPAPGDSAGAGSYDADRDEPDNPWRLALESSGEGLWDWNVATGEQTHSRQWKEMLGFSVDEIGPGYHEFVTRVHPDDLAGVLAAAQACHEGRASSYAVDLRMRCKDGSWKWILSRGRVVGRDAQGRPLRMIGTHTDISERKRSEAALRDLNQKLRDETNRLQTTLASISQGILVMDATGRIDTYNLRVCELLNVPRSFFARRPTLRELGDLQRQRGDFGPDMSLVDSHARDYVSGAGKGPIPEHYLRLTPAGRTLEVKTQMLPHGGLVRTIADVTDHIQAEAARRRLDLLLDATQSIAHVGGWEADLVRDTLFWTAGVYRILETSPQEYTPTRASALRFFTPESLALVARFAPDVPDQPAMHQMELEMITAKGRHIWVSTRALTTVENGRALKRVAVLQDITERKQAETALHELNARLTENARLLETTLGSISQGIFMVDADARVGTFNPRVCELLDLSPDYLATRPTLPEITAFQLRRGDFGPDACLVDANARPYAANGGIGDVPAHYLRETRAGRTLEINSHMLATGGMVRTFADVTNYVQAEAARQRLDLLLDATQSIARVGGWEIDLVNDRVFWTAGIYRILETSEQQFMPSDTASTQQFLPVESLERVRQAYADTTRQPSAHDLELELITATGRRIWVHSVGTAIWDQGHMIKRTSVLQDITERKQAQAAWLENEERWKLALESTGDGVWDWHVQEGKEFFSKRLLEMYGFAEHELNALPEELDQRTHPVDRVKMERDRQAHFDGLTPSYVNEHRVRCKDGSWKWVLTRGMVISRDAQGQPLRMIGTHTDITDRKQSEALIWHQAHFDALTGLPNRRMLREWLEQEIRKTRRDGLRLAILFIDLDHFKEVNDTLGHGSGDLLLVEAARRIRHCVRACDMVARMGGDEFTVVLTELDADTSLEPTVQALLREMQAVFQLGGEQVFVSASIGITLCPSDATEVEELFKHADQALYVAKGAGRKRFSFFTPSLQEAALTRVRLANDLRAGLAEAQFHMVYQPIVELATGRMHKAEALLRWRHPTRGLVSPAAFIPIAEASGLIVDIGEWVFQQAADQVRQWRQSLAPDFQISINKSPVQFHHDSLANQSWTKQLERLGLPGDSMAVEITEGLLLDTSASVTDHLLALRDAGIQVALDDFGTGYSSLSYLQKFDIDFVKIDQSFVRHLDPVSTDLALCKAIIVMAHELGIKVIAEGVETAQQRDLLAAAGCDYAQGYLFAHAMPATDFEAFLRAR